MKAPAGGPISLFSHKMHSFFSTIAILAQDPETPDEKAQKEAKADAEWMNHNPHETRLYLLNVATGS